MQSLSNKQIRDVSRIIADHHTAFLINIGLGEFVPQAEVTRLRKAGLLRGGPALKSLAQDAFTFGILSDALEESSNKNLTYPAFKEWLKHRPAPLSSEERAAMNHLKRSMFTHITGLGNTIDKTTQEVLVEADKDLRRRLASHVQRELVSGIEKRKTLNEIVSSLRKATHQYTRDWTRVAATELNNAFQEGKLSTIQKANKGKDPMVFKRVSPAACHECKHLYLTKSGEPRVFRLSELLAAGSNVGRKRDDRRAVIGAVHPWCACELQEMPHGFEFGKDGNLTYTGGAVAASR